MNTKCGKGARRVPARVTGRRAGSRQPGRPQHGPLVTPPCPRGAPAAAGHSASYTPICTSPEDSALLAEVSFVLRQGSATAVLGVVGAADLRPLLLIPVAHQLSSSTVTTGPGALSSSRSRSKKIRGSTRNRTRVLRMTVSHTNLSAKEKENCTHKSRHASRERESREGCEEDGSQLLAERPLSRTTTLQQRPLREEGAGAAPDWPQLSSTAASRPATRTEVSTLVTLFVHSM
ncbi:uncharacterized protein LOC126281370 [Schistocerca gregaria]|uniref:uncharacterized protein LOC126281370 n=1 Tax=Schistocerca gregaria TaxID=7010 RepID=UPI00211DDC79|nr:uncharacterized protein LOC126281370 [Schistocerca gregaria]